MVRASRWVVLGVHAPYRQICPIPLGLASTASLPVDADVSATSADVLGPAPRPGDGAVVRMWASPDFDTTDEVQPPAPEQDAVLQSFRGQDDPEALSHPLVLGPGAVAPCRSVAFGKRDQVIQQVDSVVVAQFRSDDPLHRRLQIDNFTTGHAPIEAILC